MNNLITAGELAKLATTTKRTIHFYDEKDILKPAKIDDNGYRYYHEHQVLDYQMILLLTTLGIPLQEIKQHLGKRGGLPQLFDSNKSHIQQQIDLLQFNLDNLNRYLQNLDANGTLIKPEIKQLDPFDIFYIERVGPYAKIAQYCQELSTMLTSRGSNITTLSIFSNPTYQPKKSHIKIAFLATKDIKIKPEHKNVVKLMTFDPGKVVTYTHHGSGSLLSLFWKELEKYCRLHDIAVRPEIPGFEIYRDVNQDITKQSFEIYLPIR